MLQDIKLPRLDGFTALVDKGGVAMITFAQWWDQVAGQLEAGINGINEALNAAAEAQSAAAVGIADAAAAQTTADDATTDAAAAQTAAASATTLAGTKVAKDVGPTWTAASGTPDRAGFSEYVEPTASVTYVAAELQGAMHAAHEASQAIVALITDLRANHTLTP